MTDEVENQASSDSSTKSTKGQFLRQWMRRGAFAPVLIAGILSLMCYLQIGGHHVPDTAVVATESYGFKEWNTNFPNRAVGPGLVLDGLRWLVTDPKLRLPLLVGFQQLSAVFLVWLVWRCVRHQGTRIAWWTALLFALHPPRYIFAQTTQTETIFILFAISGLAVLLLALRREKLWWLTLAAGLLHGAAMVHRTVGLALVITSVFVLVVAGFRFWKRIAPRSWVRSSALGFLYLLGVVLPISGAIWKNSTHHGRATLIDGSGSHLYNRVVYSEKTFADSPEWDQIVAACKEEGYEDYMAINAGFAVRDIVQKNGLPRLEADELLATAAKKTLRQNPVRTALLTAESIADASSRISLTTGSRVTPISSDGALWVAGGIRKEHWEQHDQFLHKYSDEPSRTYLQTEFPAYRFGYLGKIGERLLECFFATDIIWIGLPGAILVLLVPLGGVLTRNLPATLFGMSGAGLVTIAMLTEAPLVRFWYAGAPFLLVGCLVLVGGAIAYFTSTRKSN